MYTVLVGGPDPDFLGSSSRDRNARVVERGGATLCSLETLSAYGPHAAMLVPSDVALMPDLFRDATFDAATRRTAPTRLVSHDALIVVGAASTLATLASTGALASVPSLTVGDGTLLSLHDTDARRRATRAALLATAKPSDGWVSRHCNRPMSRACSRLALAAGLSANTASFITLAVGLFGAWTAAQPGYRWFVATGVLFQLASVLDGVDGEIARATLTESPLGARIDTVVDQATYAACFIGTTIGWVREGSGMPALWSTVLIGVALALTLMRGGRFVAQHGQNASFVIIDRSVRRAAQDTGRLPLQIAAAVFTLLRRDIFAVVFLAVSLTGLRAAVPALILAGILVANLTLSLYGPELADAARAERRRPKKVATAT
ncbi:MAG: CDP-alcohol phosphatidyltransferase family protein [Vicinamibacterales bacterium]